MTDLIDGGTAQTEQPGIDDYRILRMLTQLRDRPKELPAMLELDTFRDIRRDDPNSLDLSAILDTTRYQHIRYLIESDFIEGIILPETGGTNDLFFTPEAEITEKGLKHLAGLEKKFPHSLELNSTRVLSEQTKQIW